MTEKTDEKPINVLVTVDENYLPHLNVMLSSLLFSNPHCLFHVYLLQSAVADCRLEETRRILGSRGSLFSVKVDDRKLADAPTTDRYPREMYYRIFAAQYLPSSVDRVLYLDPDLIVKGSVEELYALPLEDHLFAAASHVGPFLNKVNRIRLDIQEEGPYINSGVMLMNLRLLREEQDTEAVFRYVKEHKNALFLPDQDIISGLYPTRILPLDPFRYNMTERLFALHAPFEKDLNMTWIRENAVIIHYCGRNKPWKSNYTGQLDIFYKETVSRMNG